VPQGHPLRRIKVLVDEALGGLSPLFDEMYALDGRPSVPPERLLKAKVLQALYTIRSEALLIEALDYNLLFRWFLDLNLLEPVWDNSTFHQEPGPAAGPPDGRAVLCPRGGLGAGARLGQRRALHRGRHVDRRVGQPEELPAPDGAERPGRRRPRQPRRGLPRAKAR
jgi:hypothetical protein